MNKTLLARYALREALGLVIMGVALFWPAGRLDWWAAWAALAVMLAWIVATAIVIVRFNPGLLAERLGPRRGARPWDTAIMSLLGVIQLARYVVAGLDQRYGWTGGSPLAAQIAALIPCALGYALVVWATASNAFFSQIVRTPLASPSAATQSLPVDPTAACAIQLTSARSPTSWPCRYCSHPGLR